jgi:hypothetical protein
VPRPFPRYVLLTLLGAALAAGAAGAFAWTVDPYAVHGRPRVDGFNAKKPHVYTHARLAKRTLAAAARPRTLFLGNSRVDAGFDPRSPSLPPSARPAFNFGIPGQGLDGDYGNLVRTHALDRVQRVVIGLDFLDFPFRPSEPAPGVEGPDVPMPLAGTRLRKFLETTLSIDALVHSALTLGAQDDPFANSMTPLGLDTFDAHLGHAKREGYRAVFHQRNLENARIYIAKPRAIRGPDGRLSPSFAWLGWILDWCRARGVAVDLVIYPYHAHILELFHLSGLWPVFEDWKRVLADYAAAGMRGGEEGFRVSLWDFSGYHRIASEEVPAPGDRRTQTRWYWEAGHFKTALGDRILARLFGGAPDRGFGVRLTPDPVGDATGQPAAGRAEWRAAHPADAAYLAALYERVAGRRSGDRAD